LLKLTDGESLETFVTIPAWSIEDIQPPLAPPRPLGDRGPSLLRLVRLSEGDVRPCVEISPRDEMFSGSLDHYFTVGRSALSLIRHALGVAATPTPKRILDLPCGHGRVLRFLRAAYPKAEICAADLDDDAVEFCVRAFGAEPVLSEEDPRDVRLEGEFDLIWCGSLLTHLDADRWPEFIQLFRSHLSPNGVMCFSVNGPHTADLLRSATFARAPDAQDGLSRPTAPEVVRLRTAREYFPLPQKSKEAMAASYAAEGFGYAEYPFFPGYGLSVSSPKWISALIERFRDLELVVYGEHRWDHQDFVACTRRSRLLPPVAR
jgi:SAM-dependent methyltransferase